MDLEIKDFRLALDLIGDMGGREAAIVAQLALDLALSARFASEPLTPAVAQNLLQQRIARHRATLCPIGTSIH